MSEALREIVRGLDKSQVVAKLGPPLEKFQTERKGLWVYYYDTIEIYFDSGGVVDWTYVTDYARTE